MKKIHIVYMYRGLITEKTKAARIDVYEDGIRTQTFTRTKGSHIYSQMKKWEEQTRQLGGAQFKVTSRHRKLTASEQV